MDECFRCEIPDTRTLLFEVIYSQGVLKICRKCFIKEDLPTIKHKVIDYETIEKPIRQKTHVPSKPIDLGQKEEDVKLKDIIDRNFQQTFRDDLDLKEDLIENFHWTIMRARRMKHLTPKELGEAIKEPEIAIKVLEQGKVPENNPGIIDKIQTYFGIRIKKEKFYSREEIRKEISKIKNDDFDIFSLQDLTLSELKELKRRKETELLD